MHVVCLALLLALPGTRAVSSTGTPVIPDLHGISTSPPPSGLTASFEPAVRETRVRGAMATGFCVTFLLREEWRISGRDSLAYRFDTASGAELEIRARSAAELHEFPQQDTAAREAAALQRYYEDMIGKPAQAIVHRPTRFSGVSLWSATWIDSNFGNASHSRAVETFIVIPGNNAALELTLTNVGSREDYDVQVARMLSSLRVRTGDDCRIGISAEP